MNTCCLTTKVEAKSGAGGVCEANADQAHEGDYEAAVDATESAQHDNGVDSHEDDGNLDQFEVSSNVGAEGFP